jgi:dTDP-4-dehydrorhamnose reductase
MSIKTALVTGATGQLGRQCFRTFSEADGWAVIGTGFSRANPPSIRKVDLGDPEQVSALLDETRPDVVVHCAAERFPDRCSADPDAAKRLNVAATEHLARECAKRGIVLIYISTDYVFSGKPGEAPYAADAPTSPPNFYGETKLAGEEAVLAAGGRAVVLRVPVLYGEVEQNKESAINVLLDTVYASGKKTEMDHWSVRFPTNTADVARVVRDVADRYVNAPEGEELPKILQFSSEEKMTKYEICQTLAEIAGLPLDHVVPNADNDPNAKG